MPSTSELNKKLFFQLHPDYIEYYDQIEDDKDFREFIYALHEFAAIGKTTKNLTGEAKMAFTFIKNIIARSQLKYKKRCEINKKNIEKRHKEV